MWLIFCMHDHGQMPYLIAQQHVNLFPLQKILRIKLINDTVRDSLLIYLPVVNILLHGVISNEPIDKTASSLAIAVDTTDGLAVMAGVPRGIKYHNATCTNQVNTKAARSAHRQHSAIQKKTTTENV